MAQTPKDKAYTDGVRDGQMNGLAGATGAFFSRITKSEEDQKVYEKGYNYGKEHAAEHYQKEEREKREAEDEQEAREELKRQAEEAAEEQDEETRAEFYEMLNDAADRIIEERRQERLYQQEQEADLERRLEAQARQAEIQRRQAHENARESYMVGRLEKLFGKKISLAPKGTPQRQRQEYIANPTSNDIEEYHFKLTQREREGVDAMASMEDVKRFERVREVYGIHKVTSEKTNLPLLLIFSKLDSAGTYLKYEASRRIEELTLQNEKNKKIVTILDAMESHNLGEYADNDPELKAYFAYQEKQKERNEQFAKMYPEAKGKNLPKGCLYTLITCLFS